jgi:hypothetical protein
VSRSVLIRLDPMNVIVYLILHCILMDVAAFLVRLSILKLTCKIIVHFLFLFVFIGPPFTLSLVNSPRVNGSTVSIDFAASTPATCFLGKEFMKDCELLISVSIIILDNVSFLIRQSNQV